MAQPSVRARAMADKDQNQVWAEVKKQREAVADTRGSGRSSRSSEPN